LLIYGGKEKEIIANIENELQKTNFQKKVKKLLFIPKTSKKGNLLSGYIFCYCTLDEELVRLIYRTPRVRNFLNHIRNEKKLPEPLSPKATSEFLYLLKEYPSQAKKSNDAKFQFGNLVKVVQGEYIGCQGRITEIDDKKKILTININFLGRLTPIKVLTASCVKESET
jgi:transcription termination/antitermination protein NusG